MEKSSSVLRQICEGENNQQFPWINEEGDILGLGSSWFDPKQPIFLYTLFWGGWVCSGVLFVYPSLETGNCVS